MLMAWNVLSILKLNFDYFESLFYNRKINRYGVYVFKKERRQEGLYKSNKRICNTIISHVNRNEF